MLALANYQLRCGAVVVGGAVWREDSTSGRVIFPAHGSEAFVYRWHNNHSWWAMGHWADYPRGPYSTRDGAMLAALRAAGVR